VNYTERAENYHLVIAVCALVTVATRNDHRKARNLTLAAYLFKVCNARREEAHSRFTEKMGFALLACNLILMPNLGGARWIVSAPVAGAGESGSGSHLFILLYFLGVASG
jgi:hypothetical protein